MLIPREDKNKEKFSDSFRMEKMGGFGYEVEASFFFMFESTGDSEVDARPAERGSVAMEEDDAESCSYDDLGSERSDSHDFEDECCEEEEEGGGGRGGSVKVEEEARRGEGGRGGFDRYKSCVSVESKSGGDFMNEMERNKLFWEACLAS